MNLNSHLQKHVPHAKHIDEMVSQWRVLLVAHFFRRLTTGELDETAQHI
jgi:hypothetical protein